MIHGRNLIILADGVAIAAAKSCEISVNTEAYEVSSPATAGWRYRKVGRSEWSVSVSTLVTEFYSRFNLGQKVTLTMAVCEANGMTTDRMIGTAYIKKSEITAQLGNLVQGGFTFQGIGVLQPLFDAEIEYLESTGTQWINTGYIMTSRNFEITIVVQWVGNDSSLFETFCGYMKADGINPRSGFHKYTGKWMFGTNTTYTTNTSVDANKHTFLLTGNASTNIESLYIDGVYNSQTTTASTGLSSNNLGMYLFARNRGTTIDNPAKIRIYSFHVVIYNEPAHTTIYGEYDFIPVRVGNVGYMYDKVSGQLFGNSGTGSFVLGPDKTT